MAAEDCGGVPPTDGPLRVSKPVHFMHVRKATGFSFCFFEKSLARDFLT